MTLHEINDIEFGEGMTMHDLETINDHQAALDTLDMALAKMDGQVESYHLDEDGRGNRDAVWLINVNHARRMQKIVRVRVHSRITQLKRDELLVFLERELGGEFDRLAAKWGRCYA